MVYNSDYTKVETVWYNPWNANVPIMGTNGFQFQPLIDQSMNLTLFAEELGRPLAFTYNSTETELYPHINLLNYTASIGNQGADYIYGTTVNGTSNLTSIFNFPYFASGSFFCGVEGANESIPTISGAPSQCISTMIGIDSLSGITVMFNRRFQYNTVLQNDGLLIQIANNPAAGLFVPVVNINRAGKLTQDQIDTMMASILKAYNSKWLSFGLLIGLGCVVTAIGVFFLVKWRKIAPAEVEDDTGVESDEKTTEKSLI